MILTVLAIAIVIFLAWAATVTIAWALVHGASLIERRERTHYRSDGPVVIDPDVKETIHVVGAHAL